jgi:hypothetical protein
MRFVEFFGDCYWFVNARKSSVLAAPVEERMFWTRPGADSTALTPWVESRIAHGEPMAAELADVLDADSILPSKAAETRLPILLTPDMVRSFFPNGLSTGRKKT